MKSNSNKLEEAEGMIVTFSCSGEVHLYERRCGLLPMWPYRSHADVDSAKRHLESQGKKFTGVKVHKKIKEYEANGKNG